MCLKILRHFYFLQCIYEKFATVKIFNNKGKFPLVFFINLVSSSLFSFKLKTKEYYGYP